MTDDIKIFWFSIKKVLNKFGKWISKMCWNPVTGRMGADQHNQQN